MFNLQGARSAATESRPMLDLLGKASHVVDMFGDEAWFNNNNNGSLEVPTGRAHPDVPLHCVFSVITSAMPPLNSPTVQEVDEVLFRLLVQLESIEHT